MTISELQKLYGAHPNISGLASILNGGKSNSNKANSSANNSKAKGGTSGNIIKTIYLGGVHGSCASFFFSAYTLNNPAIYIFILNDNEEAGYFYHDLVQANGDANILFFPSSYRRAIKYGQKDAANEILRTEVLSRLEKKEPVVVVTYPDALAEKVVSQKTLTDKTVMLNVGQNIDTENITKQLSDLGFEHVDYVYEPGQFATRGSILDVFSFASEYPYRVDFFGDEIDSIRTFEVETQLSKEKRGYFTVDKGSVTVNGVSLTVCNPTSDSFQVAIIPYTYEHTNFHTFKIGSVVNIEFDIIGKYLSRMMQLTSNK